LLAAAGLEAEDFVGPPPRMAGCGLEFAYLSVRPDAVPRSRPDPAGADVVVFAWDPAQRRAHTRVFAPSVGVPEDPATGSAALGFGVWLAAAGLLPADGPSSYVIRQGVEMHRPSILECSLEAAAGAAVRVSVTGSVVRVAGGEIAVPPFVG
jgi:trans-2,3-dihydro-3-hydroxyanthranilate isomerase